MASRRRSHGVEYVEKEQHQVVASLPNFQLGGYLHLPQGDDVERSLWVLAPSFVPLTNVAVTFIPQPEVSWHREVVILNRRKAQITLPS